MENSEMDSNYPRRTLFSGHRKLYVAVLFLALALGYLAVTVFQGAAVFYFTVDELVAGEADASGVIRVSGRLQPESFRRESGGTVARFNLIGGGEVLPAVHDGIFPELFFNEHSDIVLEGRYGIDGVFRTTTSPLVSCPSKYEATTEEGESAQL